MRNKIITKSERETRQFGQTLAKSIRGGVVLGLVGELGSGKTQFVKGLAKGLGIKLIINSPTFVVLKNYRLPARIAKRSVVGGRITDYGLRNLIHIDCYRLNSPRELLDLGFEEYIKAGNNIIAVEWAEKVKSILPKDTVWIKFKARGEKEREIVIQ